jgi:hypothetical protein
MKLNLVESKIIDSVNGLIQDLSTFAINMGTQTLLESNLEDHNKRLEQAIVDFRLDKNVEDFERKVADSVKLLQVTIA